MWTSANIWDRSGVSVVHKPPSPSGACFSRPVSDPEQILEKKYIALPNTSAPIGAI